MRRIYLAIMILLIIPVPVFLGNYMREPESRIYGMYPPDFCEMNISKTNFHNITIDLKKGSIDIKSLCNRSGGGIRSFRSFTPPSISRNVRILNRNGNFTTLLIEDLIKMGNETHSLRRQIVNITALGKGRNLVVISTDGKVERFIVETNVLWTDVSTGTVNRSIKMTLLRVNGTEFHYLNYIAVHSDYIMVFSHILSLGTEGYNGSLSFMNIIPRKKTNMSPVDRSLELIGFTWEGRIIPEPLPMPPERGLPLSRDYCIVPVGMQPYKGAQPDYGVNNCPPPPPSVSDLYKETEEALKDLSKAYSGKDISKYYDKSSDDMGYLSDVLKKKGYNRYVYGEHNVTVSTGGSMYPCEEQCYKCCSKWNEECKHKAWNKYISTPNVFESAPVACIACAASIGITVVDWGHLAEMIASRTLKGLFVGLGTIGLDIFTCGDCANKAGKYIKDLSECCIGEWYDCDCRCVSIRW